MVLGVLGERDGAAEPPLVGERAVQQPAHVVVGERFEGQQQERESSGEITEKYGFSVVAATRVTQRFSTAGSSESCWVLLKRWTSSTNRTVSRR